MKWTTTQALIGALLLGAAPLAAASPQPDSLQEIQAEVAEARKAREVTPHTCMEWIERCQALAAASADADERYDLLLYTLTLASMQREDEDVQASVGGSIDAMIEGYSDDLNRIGPLVDRFMRADPHGALPRIAAKSKLPGIKGLCAYAQVYPIVIDSKYKDLPKEERERVVGIMKGVVAEYGDAKDHRGRVLRDLLSGDIVQLSQLQVGMIAPDIVGSDLDGVEFKLSDYRGKVVVIDFWGNW